MIIEEKLNIAAEYATGLNFFVGRVARNCRDLLGKDDVFMEGIVDDWKSSNNEYVHAGKLWVASRVVRIIQQTEEEFGSEKGRAAGALALTELSEVISGIGSDMVDAVLVGNHEEQFNKCNGFPDEIRAGQYDITSESEHYSMLMAIIETVNKS